MSCERSEDVGRGKRGKAPRLFAPAASSLLDDIRNDSADLTILKLKEVITDDSEQCVDAIIEVDDLD